MNYVMQINMIQYQGSFDTGKHFLNFIIKLILIFIPLKIHHISLINL